MRLNIRKGKRPNIELNVSRVESSIWRNLEFDKHHYLTNELNKSAKCLLFTWEQNPVAFVALLNTPRKGLPHDISISRMVILPQFQGLGISSQIMNFCGGIVKNQGEDYRLLIKTIHEKVGKFLENSNNWKATLCNGKYRKGLENKNFKIYLGLARSSFCYVYCGEKISGYEKLLLPINITREIKYGVQYLNFD